MAKHAKHAAGSKSSARNSAANAASSATGRRDAQAASSHDFDYADDEFDFLDSPSSFSKADDLSFQSTSSWDDMFVEDEAPRASLPQSNTQITRGAGAHHANANLAPRDFDAPAKKKKGKGGKVALVILILILLCVLGAGAVVVFKPEVAQPYVLKIQEVTHISLGTASADGESSSDASSSNASALSNSSVSDNNNTAENIAKDEFDSHTRLIAQCQGVDIYSPIAQKDITGVLFHQASYEWGQVLTTELPEADLSESNILPVNNDQTEGEWADVEVAHLYRETDSTEMDTSIDVGAKAGTVVHAPVTGTVIAVIDYDLYDELPDVQIHIRPDANPDLDVVLLHQYDPQVKQGDHVEGGVTEISYVRDIASALTDVQLGFYTEESDPGNHSHVQVNDLTNEEYVEKYGLEVD